MTIYSYKNPPDGFYTYAYLRDDNTPYYIGKGQDKRAWKHAKTEVFRTPKDHSRIIILEANLSEVGALALERFYIRWYGRKNENTGILRNKTAGGEGISGFKHSQDTKDKIREKRLGSIPSSEARLKQSRALKGVKRGPHSLERRAAISKSRKGYTYSTDRNAKVAAAHTGKKRVEHGINMTGANNPSFGKHWFNNGEVSILTFDCPEGFAPGMLR